MVLFIKIFAFLLLFLHTAASFAAERYSVIGVIAGTRSTKNVAVIWDEKEQRSLTVTEGAVLGGHDVVVKKIARGHVEILQTDGQAVVLGARVVPRPGTLAEIILQQESENFADENHPTMSEGQNRVFTTDLPGTESTPNPADRSHKASDYDKRQREALMNILNSDQVADYFSAIQEEREELYTH